MIIVVYDFLALVRIRLFLLIFCFVDLMILNMLVFKLTEIFLNLSYKSDIFYCDILRIFIDIILSVIIIFVLFALSMWKRNLGLLDSVGKK